MGTLMNKLRSQSLPKPRIRPRFDRVIEVYGSDIISRVRYDANNSVLDCRIKVPNSDARWYRYYDVGSSDFTALVTSRSPGKVFNERIKRNRWTLEERKAAKLRS